MASNLSPLDLCSLGSEDYRSEPLVPGAYSIFSRIFVWWDIKVIYQSIP
jgi:hypothetical protein